MNGNESGKWLNQNGYRSFDPSRINRAWKFDEPRIMEALSRADRQLGRLDMFSEYVPKEATD
jgi:hypothetical protein